MEALPMVRSIWKRTLVTTFAWAGLAWAQQPISSAPAAKPGETTGQTFTVQEAGKAGQKCKVLKTWKTHDGKIAYQVQALDTGEMMTIVETGSARDMVGTQGGTGTHAQAVATRIFHWGLERMPPPGTPVPPVEEFYKMPSSMSDSQPKKLASTELPSAGKPIAPTYSEPGKSSTFFPWFSRSTPAQPAPMPANLPQPSVLNSTPTPQSTTAL